MPVLFRPTSAGAAQYKDRALKLGNAMLALPNTSSIQHQMIDGYLMRAVRNGPNVIVTLLDMPTYFCNADSWLWTGGTLVRQPLVYYTFTAPQGRSLFDTKNELLPELKQLSWDEQKPWRINVSTGYLGRVDNSQEADRWRGPFSDSQDGVVCVRTSRYTGLDNLMAVAVQRASAAMSWYPDTMSLAEVNEATKDKSGTISRTGDIQFVETLMAPFLGGMGFHSGGDTGYTLENSAFETDAANGLVCAHTSDPVPDPPPPGELLTRPVTGALLWRYFLVMPPDTDGNPANNRPNVGIRWAYMFRMDSLPSGPLKPSLEPTGQLMENYVRLTMPAFNDDTAMAVMGVEASHHLDTTEGGVHVHSVGIGLVAVVVNQTSGGVSQYVVDQGLLLPSEEGYDPSEAWFYTPTLGITRTTAAGGPCVVCLRAREHTQGDYINQRADDIQLTIVYASGSQTVVDIPGHWPAHQVIGNPIMNPDEWIVGTALHTMGNPFDGYYGLSNYVRPVCEYAEDVLAVVCAPNSAFGDPGATAVSRQIALVRVSTGALLEVRDTGFAGNMWQSFGLSCPRRAQGHFEAGTWVEDVPGSLLLAVDQPQLNSSAPAPDDSLRGLWLSNDGGRDLKHLFRLPTSYGSPVPHDVPGSLFYFLGSQFTQHPMRSADAPASITTPGE